MSERQKLRLLAVNLILLNAGVKISDNMKKIVESIEKERQAQQIARA